MAKRGASIVGTAGPFMLFVLGGWLGIMSLVQKKRDMHVATRGVDNVEEMDPLERMRKAYGLNATSQQREPTRIASIEEELASINSKIDIRDFDYKPVPRPVDD
mmetsp:Transcript_3745/g.10576  ORF Transcript_3745/g.10576 Transcript_3745/m.10576 type:complete len:104 (+) Transcript_3745:438-749(+)